MNYLLGSEFEVVVSLERTWTPGLEDGYFGDTAPEYLDEVYVGYHIILVLGNPPLWHECHTNTPWGKRRLFGIIAGWIIQRPHLVKR